MKTCLRAAAIWLTALSWPRVVAAEESCTGPITRNNLSSCALRDNPALRAELSAQRAAEARRESASHFLPSNPVLNVSAASRVGTTERAVNWYLTLGQEFELAGQGALRADAANGELRAQQHRVEATRRELLARAWHAYFSALATRERLSLATRLEAASRDVAVTVRAMADNGVASALEAEVADASALRTSQARLEAERARREALAELARFTGSDEVDGVLEPLVAPHPNPLPEGEGVRPELLELRAQGAAARTREELYRREVVPNLTVSFVAQNDGFNERVLGAGVSIPIPLPQPVGKTRAGEIAGAQADAENAAARAESLKRALQVELTSARAALDAAEQTTALYTPERAARASALLENIAVQVKAARLPVRDALIAQQALVEQLEAGIAAREARCLASVRVAYAAGLSLEGVAP